MAREKKPVHKVQITEGKRNSLYIDAIHYSIKDNGVIRKLAAYVILGINTEKKESADNQCRRQ